MEEMRLLLFILDTAMLKEQELLRDWEGHPEAFTSTGHTLFLKWVGGGNAQAFRSLNCTQRTLYTLPCGCFVSNKTGF